MRSQLLVSGILVMLMGLAFYILQIPIAYSWSVVFIAGGAIMAGGSLFVGEKEGPIEAPDGYRFCRFCSATVPLQAARCPKCNGLQQAGGT
ncbi:MAG TPA: hypothetical protein VEC02_02065 [Nitrososphaerales archaeon]|nr:hypothetical protein [Nitrososphaerales archaeon]